MIDKLVNFLGSTPILGSVAPIATGSALASKLSGSDDVTVAFFGDGASEEGVVYESINFAALFKLPVIFVIENNLYSVMSKLRDRRPADFSHERIVAGIGATYLKADGNDYVDVFQKAKAAVANASKGRPTVLECVVFRHMAHSAPLCDDKAGYREIDTLQEREKQCPIRRIKTLLGSDEGTIRELVAIEEATISRCKDYIVQGERSPYPSAEELMTDIYAPASAPVVATPSLGTTATVYA